MTFAFTFPSVVDGLNCAALPRAQFERTLAGGVHAVNLPATLHISACMGALAAVVGNPDGARIVTTADGIPDGQGAIEKIMCRNLLRVYQEVWGE